MPDLDCELGKIHEEMLIAAPSVDGDTFHLAMIFVPGCGPEQLLRLRQVKSHLAPGLGFELGAGPALDTVA